MFAMNDSETAVPALVSKASGVVLELGPGIGSQLPRYDKSKISKIYGVEPVTDLHKALREKIKASGLTDIYEIVPYGIEDVEALERHGIVPETIDTVLSVQVLCSVPEPDRVLKRLHAFMKPEGHFLVYEHVRSNDVLSWTVQNFYTIFWPFFVGNCCLNRNTQSSIMQAGDWEKIELSVPSAEDAWSVFPRIHGQLWKSKVHDMMQRGLEDKLNST